MQSLQSNDQGIHDLLDSIRNLRNNVTISSLSPTAAVQLQRIFSLPEDSVKAITARRVLNLLYFEDMEERFDDVRVAHEGTFTWALGGNPALEPLHAPGPLWSRGSGLRGRCNPEPARLLGDTETLRLGQPAEAEAEDDEPREAHRTPPAVNSPPKTQLSYIAEKHGVSVSAPCAQDEGCPNRFADWLQSGEGIFHVVGKAGSGKSTFMKFLCDHTRAMQLLQTWSSKSKLVFAKFFFWSDGAKKQKSIAGLCRSLLYNILEECPELISHALPEVWRQVDSSPWQVEVKLQVRHDHIREALARLLQESDFDHAYKFCIFIDGLNDNQEMSFDYAPVNDLLRGWAVAGQDRLKICFASRPQQTLLNAFSATQRLWIHDHTWCDVRRLVFDRLQLRYAQPTERESVNLPIQSMSLDHGKQAIAEEILRRADGDFCWVSIATNVVERLFQHSPEDISKLRKLPKLSTDDHGSESLPNDLDQLGDDPSSCALTDILDRANVPPWPTIADPWLNTSSSARISEKQHPSHGKVLVQTLPRVNKNIRQCQIKELAEYLRISDNLEDDLIIAEDARVGTTCQWFSARSSYRSWRESESRAPKVLWVTGKPAAGKSTLAGYVINELRKDCADCSFYFFKHADKSKSRFSACLKALAFQMALKSDRIRKKLLETKSDNVGLDGDLDNERMLWRRLFVDGILQTPFETQYWVIDALDECENSAAAFSSMLGKASESIPLRILITSRETSSLLGEFSNLGSRRFRAEEITPVDTLSDIKLLIEAKAKALVTRDEESRDELVGKIVAKSKGSFLWTVLVLKELSRACSDEEASQVLDDVPRGMESLYHRTLQTMSQAEWGKKAAKAILTWTTCATRPLRTSELDEALRIHIEENFPRLETSIAALCGQLVAIDKFGNVQMVHETAREFLLSKGLQSEFAVNPEHAHTQIVKVCLEYLTGEEMTVPRSSRRGSAKSVAKERSAFSTYACASFSHHLTRADPCSHEVLILLDKFLKGSVLSWIELVASKWDLSPLVQASNDIRTYLNSCRAHDLPLKNELLTAERWTTDLIRISAKFADALVASPSAIFSLVPPFCPTNSAVYNVGKPGRGPSVVGLLNSDWDDRLSCIDFHARTSSVSHGDKFFAVGLATGVVALYYAVTGQEYRTMRHNEPVSLVSFLNNSGLMASCGTKTIRVWNVSTGEPVHTFQAPRRCISIAHDKGFLIAACDRNFLASWDLRNAGVRQPDRPWGPGNECSDTRLRRPPSAISISLGHKMLAVAYPGRPIILWDLEEDSYFGSCGKKLASGETSKHLVTALVFNPNPIMPLLAASYLDGELVIFDPFEDVSLGSIRANCPKLAASPDGRLLAGAAGSGTIDIYAFESLALLYRVRSSNTYITQLAFSRDSLHFVDIRGSLCNVWEPAALRREPITDKDSNSIPLPFVDVVTSETKAKIRTIVLHTEEKYALCGEDDGSVALYDLRDGSRVKTLYGHKSYVRSLTWCHSLDTVMSIDASNCILAWKLEQSQHDGLVIGPQIFQARLDCGRTVTQSLIGEVAGKFVLSTRESDHLWNLEGQEERSRTCVETPGMRKWIQHQQSPLHVLCIENEAVRIYTWSDFSEVACIPLSIGATDLQLKNVVACVMNRKHAILLELSDLDGGADTRSMHLLDGEPSLVTATVTDKITTSATSAQGPDLRTAPIGQDPARRGPIFLQDPELSRFSNRVSHIIGFSNAGKLVFLDKGSWVCSLELEHLGHDPLEYSRHFFVPYDWLSGSRAVVCAVSRRSVIFARNDRVAVVKGGLECSEKMTVLLKDAVSRPGATAK